MNDDFKELLSLFNELSVEYLVVGGFAVIEYAEPRYTKDIDLWIRANAANSVKVFEALQQFGAPLANLTAADFADEDAFYQMGRPPHRVDVLMSIPGLAFDEAWDNRYEADIEGVNVRFIGIHELIRAKEASGRPQDLIDITNLRLALKRLEKKRR